MFMLSCRSLRFAVLLALIAVVPATAQDRVRRFDERQSIDDRGLAAGGSSSLRVDGDRRAGNHAADYVVSVSPNPIHVSGGRQTFMFVLSSIDGFAGPVTVSMSTTGQVVALDKNCPNGTYCPYQETTYPVPADSSIADNAIASTTGPDGGTITITTKTPGLPDKQTTVNVTAGPAQPGFDLSVNPANPTIPQGQNGTVTVALQRTNGFTGEVIVDVTGPDGWTFSPESPLIFAAGETAKQLTIRVPADVPPAPNHIVTLFANAPSISDSQMIDITVNVTPASQPDFTITATPSSLTATPNGEREFTVSVVPQNGYNTPVVISMKSDPNVSLLQGGGTVNPGSSTLFRIRISPTAPAPSTIVLEIFGNATSGELRRETHVTVNVEQPQIPDFTFTVTPNPLALTQGSSATATVSVTRSGGFTGEVQVTGTATASGVTVGSVTVPAGQSTGTLNIAASQNAATGPATIQFSANAPSIPKTQNAVVNLQVNAAQAPPDFNISVTPAEVQITGAGTTHVTVTLTRQNFTGDVTVAASNPSGIAVTPQTFTFSGGTASRDFDILVSGSSPAGRSPIMFTATAATLSGVTRTASAGVTVIPVAGTAPVLTAITPGAVVAGAHRAVVVLSGLNFSEGAVALSASPFVVIESTDVESDGIATAVVSVDPLAVAGPVEIMIRNADGATSVESVDLIVYEEGDIGAPLGVTAAAILAPLGGKIITNADRPYATGVVATTGSGTITGRWLFDGGTFDSFTITVSAGEPAMVTSRVPIPASHAGPHQLQLVIDAPRQAQSAAVAIRMAVDSASNLTVFAPASEGSGSAAGDAEVLRWSMVPGALGYVVEIVRDGQPFPTAVEAGQEAELTLDPADYPIGGGALRWRVAPMYCCSGTDHYTGPFTEWQELTVGRNASEDRRLFESVRDAAIADATTPALRSRLASLSADAQADSLDVSPLLFAQATTVPSSAAAGKTSGLRTDWSMVPMITSTLTRHADTQDGSFQLSGQGDVGLSPLSSKYTTDFTGANIFDDHFTFKGSRNWIVNVGNARRSKRAIRPEAVLGYGPPDFFRGTQLVTSTLARGGALGRVATRYGALAYYSTFTDALDGVIAGNFGMQQKIDAVALELPETKKFSMKLITMRVEDLPLASQYAPRGEGRSLGLLTTYKLSPRLHLTAEAARGRGEWTTVNGLREREGDAFRVGVTGMRGRTTYRADLNHTDSDFSNPGSRGFTTAGIPNRTGGTLNLSRSLGKGTATIGVRHQTQTRSAVAARATGLNLGYAIQLNSKISLNATANTNVDSADADASRRMPGTDRRQLGATATLSERFGRLNLSQTLSHQRLDDDINRAAANSLTTLSLSGGGTIVKNFDLFATTTIIRTDAAPLVGDGNNITFSLQPTFAIPRLYLSLQPRISFNHATNDYRRSSNRNEQYAAVLQWSPNWFRKVGTMQLSSNWNRDAFGLPGTTTRSMNRSYVGTMTLKWGEGVGADMFRRNRLPGEVAVSGREGASADPVNGRTTAKTRTAGQ